MTDITTEAFTKPKWKCDKYDMSDLIQTHDELVRYVDCLANKLYTIQQSYNYNLLFIQVILFIIIIALIMWIMYISYKLKKLKTI